MAKLAQMSDSKLRALLEQIGRNGEPKPGSAAAARREEIDRILAERSSESYCIGDDGAVICGGQGGNI